MTQQINPADLVPRRLILAFRGTEEAIIHLWIQETNSWLRGCYGWNNLAKRVWRLGVERRPQARMARRYFEDITEGERLHCKDVAITREDIIEFAKRFDPQPFHTDENAAKESFFGGLIASSFHTLSACTRAVLEAQGTAIFSGVGMDAVKMFHPVRPGEVLSVEAWWVDLKRSESKPGMGFAGIRCKVANQKGEPVIEYGYRYILGCRDSCQPYGRS